MKIELRHFIYARTQKKIYLPYNYLCVVIKQGGKQRQKTTWDPENRTLTRNYEKKSQDFCPERIKSEGPQRKVSRTRLD